MPNITWSADTQIVRSVSTSYGRSDHVWRMRVADEKSRHEILFRRIRRTCREPGSRMRRGYG
jgi:hypothetical protein